MFCDEHEIKVVAGKGGDGCSSFRREKFVPYGGPDGGDGGNGGNVILKVNHQINTLANIRHQTLFKAENGKAGQGKNMYGRTGQDLIIEVPIGTIVFEKEKNIQIADLNQKDSQILIARGGQGGRGNKRFANSTNKAPRFSENGEPGETKDLRLELKLVADIGLIGLPSAGKSTLISVISNAKPKIADYHFTTLIPNLGIVKLNKFGGDKNESFIVADIPGLIEGASQGKGLGLDFLKHISRTKILVHLIDASLEDTEKNYKTIKKELETFDKDLIKKQEIIVINKIDLISEKDLKEKISKLKSLTKKEIFAISALNQEGLKQLVFKMLEKIKEENEKNVLTKEIRKEIPTLAPHKKVEKFYIAQIKKVEKKTVYEIKGEKIEKIAIMTNISDYHGKERLYSVIDNMGIKQAVFKKGALVGDYYQIGEKYLEIRK